MKRLFSSFFGTSSKEVNGIIILVIVFLMSMAYPTLHHYFSAGMEPLSPEDVQQLDSLVVILSTTNEEPQVAFEQFPFDPNTAEAASLSRLGFTSRTIKQIINYRNSGGQFRVKKDLLKIYSIDSVLVMDLYDFIDLPAAIQPVSQVRHLSEPESKTVAPSAPVKPRVFAKFDLNTADTAMLQTVRGIGSVLSKRIIAFRDKLGGFVYPTQLYEVYNLDSSVVEQLWQTAYLDEASEPQKLTINLLSEEALATHPYITPKQARLIVAYRNQHGSFSNAEDLMKVYLVDSADVKRLEPYLQFDNLSK